ncbi:MAG: RNA polymerase factor sigma-54 [Lentisphaeria bacterium]|nr:RNA polymerase factor sigma-54 [Lentisphaeria bacterium]
MSSIEQHLQTGLTQQQTTALSMQQRLGLELLHLPLQELENRLAQELISNPVLEELPPEPAEATPQEHEKESQNDDDYESAFEVTLAENDRWTDELPLPANAEADDDDRKLDFLSNSPASAPALTELLLIELETNDLPDNIRKAAIEIIFSIDPDGFLRVNLADLAMSCDCEMDEMQTALALVQELAPPGVGARDLPECLELQLKRRGKLDEKMHTLIHNHLDDVAQGNLSALQKKLAISAEELDKMLALLRQLAPVPGTSFNSAHAPVVMPELEIEQLPDGTFIIRQLRENFRKITISNYYEKLLEDASLSSDDRKYLNEKLLRARELIKSLTMRDSTLTLLGKLIIEQQEEFLHRGIAGLKTFTMREAGALLGYDESTISRAVADKFIRTPHGVFPLRFFFSSGGGSSGDGEKIAAAAIMEQIRQIIAQEEPAKPVSDENIARTLSEQGINVARRTVAKYRDALKIPPASARKRR